MKVSQFQKPSLTLLQGGVIPQTSHVRLAPCVVDRLRLILADCLGISSESQKAIESQLPVNGLAEAGSFLLYIDENKVTWLFIHLPEAAKSNKELLLKIFANAGRFLLKKSLDSWCLGALMPGYESDFVIEGALEGLLLSLHPVSSMTKADSFKTVSSISTVYPRKASWDFLEAGSYGVHFARAMINTNADEMTPTYMAELAQSVAKCHSQTVRCHVLDEKAIEDEKMGLLLAVARASRTPPRLVILEYTPKNQSTHAPIALVGKGISYDTGGFSLKPQDSMKGQRADMSGAATVLAAFEAAVSLELPYPLIAVMVCAENAIGSAGYKLGDTYISRSGKSVEVVNTDAEGRLVLADAFDYVQEKYKPQVLIDVATLTGAAIIALGHEVAAILSPDDKLAAQLIQAAKGCGERLWQLPLYEEYKEYLSSDVADMKNAGPRIAGTCVAGVFLQQFIYPGVSWAHLDIAGVAFAEKEKFFFSKLATGFGVRSLLKWLFA